MSRMLTKVEGPITALESLICDVYGYPISPHFRDVERCDHNLHLVAPIAQVRKIYDLRGAPPRQAQLQIQLLAECPPRISLLND